MWNVIATVSEKEESIKEKAIVFDYEEELKNIKTAGGRREIGAQLTPGAHISVSNACKKCDRQ